MVSLYCFNRLKVGNLKLDNSNVGSNSPKSFTILSDKFSATLFSSSISSTSISKEGISSSKVGVCFSSTFSGISAVLVTGSECFEMVGCKFSKDNSNSDFKGSVVPISFALETVSSASGSVVSFVAFFIAALLALLCLSFSTNRSAVNL